MAALRLIFRRLLRGKLAVFHTTVKVASMPRVKIYDAWRVGCEQRPDISMTSARGRYRWRNVHFRNFSHARSSILKISVASSSVVLAQRHRDPFQGPALYKIITHSSRYKRQTCIYNLFTYILWKYFFPHSTFYPRICSYVYFCIRPYFISLSQDGKLF